ncbi:MAG: acyltransferase [SAR324 cluster bacterium]|uniref:Acyltransferase n=1 Tax=SAR324 cluster bacterium TaxID=2024889 RepID=A0A7X9FS32_9DELT|nr:acyltransferase [SAR324 cluster bacterium]
MELGSRVMLDDYSVLDIRGRSGGIQIGDYVSIGRFTTVVAKEAQISISDGVNIGSYCRIATQSKIEIGSSTLFAAYCYIGPGNHQQGDEETPLISRAMEIKGGVKIGAHCWFGAHTTVLDGVSIGEGSIIGAHSLVRSDIPPHVIAAGVPAKVIRELKS